MQNLIETNSYLSWPNVTGNSISHEYCSTLFIQQFYKNNHFIPYLSCNTGSLRWAYDFLNKYVLPRSPVVVHLKNNPNCQHCSNADFDVWYAFFKKCEIYNDILFILTGNEKTDPRFNKLSNIVKTSQYGSNLSRDLALIQTAYLFMGSSSGPSNMAIFSDVPYIIYKDPDHDREGMEKEIGNGDRFPFARPFQNILRVRQNTDSLIDEFGKRYNLELLAAWKKRLSKFKLQYTTKTQVCT